MMGFFSVYMGLIYNEFFAIPYDWFGTCYDTTIPPNASTTELEEYNFYLKKGGNPTITGDPTPYTSKEAYDCAYPVGLDPTWFLSVNNISTV